MTTRAQTDDMTSIPQHRPSFLPKQYTGCGATGAHHDKASEEFIWFMDNPHIQIHVETGNRQPYVDPSNGQKRKTGGSSPFNTGVQYTLLVMPMAKTFGLTENFGAVHIYINWFFNTDI